MATLVGQRLGNNQIIALLGEGGMATVYRAQQLSIKREVAVKVIRPELAHSEDFLRRFAREAEAMAALDHPHIIKLYEYGEQDGMVYMVTPLLRGGSLDELIRKGPLPLEMTSRLLDQMCSALSFAHYRGVIHRDLKPQNVLLDEEGNAFITDFGIARMLTQTSVLTQSGMAIGTPSYMPPEQWQGGTYDARADLYALGIVLFEMLTGRLPFDAKTPARMMYLHLEEPPPSITSLRPDLPAAIGPVLTKALAKRPEDRFPSANELAKAFRAAVTGQPYLAPDPITVSPLGDSEATLPPSGPAASPTQPASRGGRSTLLGIGVVVIILLLLGGSISVILGGRSSATATTTPSNTIISFPTITQTTAGVAALVTPTDTPVLTQPESVALTPTATETTVTASPTPNQEQTISAIVNSTLTVIAANTALAGPSATLSLTAQEDPTSTLTASATGTPNAISFVPTTSSVPCTISTDQVDTVAVRVGPGLNRGIKDYLAPGQPFEVVGQAQASDGSQWWKLNTDDNSEAWVAQTDVTASAGCDQVDVAPTPPIQTARPTATKTPTPKPTNTPKPKKTATPTIAPTRIRPTPPFPNATAIFQP